MTIDHDVDPVDPVDPATGIPNDIVEAMTDQMRTVLSIQASRASACAQAGRQAAETVTGQEAAELERMRAEYRAERSCWNEDGPVMARTDDSVIRTAGVDVPIRIHRPTEAALLPGIVFAHGGGFTLGDLDTHDRIQRVLAAESGAAVIGVDYSLSPEVSYPQALHETAGIVDRIARHGEEFDLDSSRVCLGGDSAGAMLTMGAALLLRDHPESIGLNPESFSAIKALLLFYGGHGLHDSASRRLYGGAWDGMSADDLAAINTVYFSSPTQADEDYVNHLGA
ncbi:MAG: alpha/beta hydrolase fold domain-containing protein, partial [Kocuria sp.]|nr:alpha/beta hydrolase fold domain-containing protein [Kocuria sp.]